MDHYSPGAHNCGFAPPSDAAETTSNDTANLLPHTRFIYGPAPAGTVRVVITSDCGPHDATDFHDPRTLAIVSTHPLPSWVPRQGQWFVARTVSGSCYIAPTAYLAADGRHLKFGTF